MAQDTQDGSSSCAVSAVETSEESNESTKKQIDSLECHWRNWIVSEFQSNRGLSNDFPRNRRFAVDVPVEQSND